MQANEVFVKSLSILKGMGSFQTRMSPVFIPLIFWLLFLASFVSAIKLIFTGGLWLGLIVLILPPVLFRVICEALLNVHDIANSKTK